MSSFTFQIATKLKRRLKRLAALRNGAGVGRVSMGALVCEAVEWYLDVEETHAP